MYRFNVAEHARAAKLLLINATIGKEGLTFRYLPLNNGKYAISQSFNHTAPVGSSLAKIVAVDDTLKVTADGYKEKTVERERRFSARRRGSTPDGARVRETSRSSVR